MTLDEKISMVTGAAGIKPFQDWPEPPVGARGGDGFVAGIPRLRIPPLQLIGAGLGVTDLGSRANGQSTALPSTLALASSFDIQLAYEMGSLIGDEAQREGFNVLLGGGANLTRDPRGGRAFEYHGEDPVLTGRLVASTLQGTWDRGVITTLKHFAMNDLENGRNDINVVIDEKSMRESELLAFEIAIRSAPVGAVMCSYNMINSVYACENETLLKTILKEEWGFRGWVISDWGAVHSTARAANAGLDQEFYRGEFFGNALRAAVSNGSVPTKRLDNMVKRILIPMIETGAIDRDDTPRSIDVARGMELAQRVAEAGSVLLKNDGILPLKADSTRTIAVIGLNSDRAVLSGAGSAQVNPVGGNAIAPAPELDLDHTVVWHPSSPLSAIREKAKLAIVAYDAGVNIASAVNVARAADITIIFAGQHRREAVDAPSLGLDDNQDAMIKAVAAVNPNTVVVLETGGAVLMPWLSAVRGVLEAWYPGQRGGPAIANLLFGDVSPSGKLPISFPASEADLPRPSLPAPPIDSQSASGEAIVTPDTYKITYYEGARVGYKWFSSKERPTLFPFGFGLTYTDFLLENIRSRKGRHLSVVIDMKNVGSQKGTQVAQAYVKTPNRPGEPRIRLAGWARKTLKPGEKKNVTITLEEKAFASWDVNNHRWVIPSGDYIVSVGASSADLALQQVITFTSDRVIHD